MSWSIRFRSGVTRLSDGGPTPGDEPDRVLREGCFHNWAIHCTVSKRYQMGRQYRDRCIGLRIVVAKP
jgi:formylglycine-generating enzyme